MARQLRQVSQPLSQGGHANLQDIQPVVEIFAKPAILDCLLQVDMGGGKNPDIDGDRPTAPDALDVLFLKKAQQIRLQLQRQIADFIQQQRSAVGSLDSPHLALMGPGEGALLVAEQLRLDEVLRNAATVDGNERLIRAAREIMQCARNHFLAGTAFAANHHRRVRGSKACDQPARFGHRPALPQQILPGASLWIGLAAQA